MSRHRVVAAAVGTLILLLVLAPLVPHGGGGEDGSLRPSREDRAAPSTPAVGWSRVTRATQREIDRVVAAGRVAGRVGTKAGLADAVSSLVRCADLAGQRYCLGEGWTEDSQAQVQARVTRAVRVAARHGRVENTGDLGAAASVARSARMAPAARARTDRAELEQAARSVGKVWLLRHQAEGVPIPRDVLAAYPAVRAAAVQRVKRPRDYPSHYAILNGRAMREQTRTYWCGPTTMQMIGGAWSGRVSSQRYWAKRLRTTTAGTAITDMVRVVNRATGWDRPTHAGPYITLDIGRWSFPRWQLLMMRHIHDYRAPVVLHPALLKRFYPYLDDDASGHFQVGRGYDKNGRKPALLGYLEPWNQHRFDPSEPAIARVQWRTAYRSYRANRAHFQHNVGV